MMDKQSESGKATVTLHLNRCFLKQYPSDDFVLRDINLSRLTLLVSFFLKLHQQSAEDAQSKGTNNFEARLPRILLGVCHFILLLTVL